jgi:hypothetical protein
MPSAKYFLNQKGIARYISSLFCNFQCTFDNNVLKFIFVTPILRAAEKATPPPVLCTQGIGYYWFFSSTSRGFGYGFEAVKIRIQSNNTYSNQAIRFLVKFSSLKIVAFWFLKNCWRGLLWT